jgi:hypothetical protein
MKEPQVLATLKHTGRLVMVATAVGLLTSALFAIQALNFISAVSVLSVTIAVAAASAAVGAALGFLFGIPRSLQDAGPGASQDTTRATLRTGSERDKASLRYAGNTSLEQISDWLTKILVGVGLTQLINLPGALHGLGTFLGPALGGFPASDEFGVFIVVASWIGGFFVGYLWTRLRFVLLLTESEHEASQIGDAGKSLSQSLRTEEGAAIEAVGAAVERALSDVGPDTTKDQRAEIVAKARSTATEELAARRVTVDLSSIHPSLAATPFQLAVDEHTAVADFLNILFFAISGFVDPFSYGQQWILRDADTKNEFREIGTEYARTWLGTSRDTRTLQEIGIRPGSRLEALRLGS